MRGQVDRVVQPRTNICRTGVDTAHAPHLVLPLFEIYLIDAQGVCPDDSWLVSKSEIGHSVIEVRPHGQVTPVAHLDRYLWETGGCPKGSSARHIADHYPTRQRRVSHRRAHPGLLPATARTVGFALCPDRVGRSCMVDPYRTRARANTPIELVARGLIVALVEGPSVL